MSETLKIKKYRLGNQPEEYELSEKYLEWCPEGCQSWKEFHKNLFPHSLTNPLSITLVHSESKEKVTLILDRYLTKEAFPISFLGEERAQNWWNFLMVADMKDEVMFVIPMH